jgi:hypothetical protein
MNRKQRRAGEPKSAAGLGMIHPVTGEIIPPIGYRRPDGSWRAISPILGAADPDPDDDDPDDGGVDKDADDKDAKDKKPDPDDDDDEFEDVKDDSDEVKRVKARARRIERQSIRRNRDNRQLQRELDGVKAELAKLQKPAPDDKKSGDDKDKEASAQSARELEEERKRSEKLAADLRLQTIRVEFLGLSLPFEWADPGDALRLLDLDDVDIDDAGKVDRKSLRTAARDLAKQKPHLVKAKTADTDGSGSTGGNVGGNNNRDRKGGPSESELLKRAPSLRGRR